MVKLLILDVDGVLTNGKKCYDCLGNVVSKNFCDKDWTSIKRLQSLGVKVIFITGDPFNESIAKNRNIPCIINRTSKGHVDKINYLTEVENEFLLTRNEMAYIGDDIFDFKIMQQIRYSFTVSDAPLAMQKRFTVLPCNGGSNVVQHFFEYAEKNKLIPYADIEDILDLVYDLDIKEKF
jgi:3-deoxy-D-manno-octulosonate 8-phosphate phosphatase (KDO 8-P phosphatase)